MSKATKIILAFCFVMIAAFAIAAVNQGVSVTTREPVSTRATALGDQLAVPYPMKVVQTAANCVAVTGTSAQFTMPTSTTGSSAFRICAGGGLASYAFISCGTNPTATTTATTGYTLPPMSDGQCLPVMEIASLKCAVIGGASVGGAAAAGGSVCFLQAANPTGMAFGS